MRTGLVFVMLAGLISACATQPPWPTGKRSYPAPVRTRTDIPPRPVQPARPSVPTSLALPNGEYIAVVSGTRPLPSCEPFGVRNGGGKTSVCVSVPASMADGRGGGIAQARYAGYLITAGYKGGGALLAYKGRNGCRQHVSLSTLPAEISRTTDWSDIHEYFVFMEFTPLTCPEG